MFFDERVIAKQLCIHYILIKLESYSILVLHAVILHSLSNDGQHDHKNVPLHRWPPTPPPTYIEEVCIMTNLSKTKLPLKG